MPDVKELKKRKMIDDYSPVDTGGKIIFLSAVTIRLAEWIGGIEFNDVTTGLMSLAGFIYIVLKAKGQYLDNKIKRKKLKNDNDESKLG